MQAFKETRESRYIYQNEVDKACFQHDMVYDNFKNLPRRTIFDKVLHGNAFNIAKNPKYDGYQRELASIVYKCFDKGSAGTNISRDASKSKIMPNQQLSEELHKPIIRKFEKQKVYL